MAQGHGTTSAPRQMLPPQETGGKDERTGGWSKTPTSSQQPEDGTKAGIHKRMQPCKSKDYGTTKTCNIPTTVRKSDHWGETKRVSHRCHILELNQQSRTVQNHHQSRWLQVLTQAIGRR